MPSASSAEVTTRIPSSMRGIPADGRRAFSVSHSLATNAHVASPFARLRIARRSRNGRVLGADLVAQGHGEESAEQHRVGDVGQSTEVAQPVLRRRRRRGSGPQILEALLVGRSRRRCVRPRGRAPGRRDASSVPRWAYSSSARSRIVSSSPCSASARNSTARSDDTRSDSPSVRSGPSRFAAGPTSARTNAVKSARRSSATNRSSAPSTPTMRCHTERSVSSANARRVPRRRSTPTRPARTAAQTSSTRPYRSSAVRSRPARPARLSSSESS